MPTSGSVETRRRRRWRRQNPCATGPGPWRAAYDRRAMDRRSPARFLAPLALAAAIFAVIVVIGSAGGGGGSSKHSTKGAAKAVHRHHAHPARKQPPRVY